MRERTTDDLIEMPAAAFTLLRKIEENNDAEWARAHSAELETRLRAPFVRFIEATSRRLAEEGLRLAGGAETTFRMWRDLRFARDRRPLNEHVEAVFSVNRRRIGCRGAICVRLDRKGGFLAAGSFRQPADARRALREAMVSRRRTFERIARDLELAGAPLTSMTCLRRAPRGFQEDADGRLAPFLRMNEPVARVALTRADWRKGHVIERTVDFARITRRWLMFQREALAQVPDHVARPPRSPGRRQGPP